MCRWSPLILNWCCLGYCQWDAGWDFLGPSEVLLLMKFYWRSTSDAVNELCETVFLSHEVWCPGDSLIVGVYINKCVWWKKTPSTLVKVIVPISMFSLGPFLLNCSSACHCQGCFLLRYDFGFVHSEFYGGPPGLFLQPVQVPLDCSSALEYIDHHQSGGTCKPDDLCHVPIVCSC